MSEINNKYKSNDAEHGINRRLQQGNIYFPKQIEAKTDKRLDNCEGYTEPFADIPWGQPNRDNEEDGEPDLRAIHVVKCQND